MQLLASLFILISNIACVLASTRMAKKSCMYQGMHVAEWYIHNFDFHASYTFSTPAHQNSWGYVNFTLENPVLSNDPVCSSSSSQLEDFYYGTVMYYCKDLASGIETSYSFNRPTGELKMNQTWTCEKEGGSIRAEGGVKFDLECTDETRENPKWQQEGGIYRSRTVKCKELKRVKVPITRIFALL